MSPKKDQTSFVDCGTGQSIIHFAFDVSALMPDDEIWWPKKLISVQNNDIFFGEQKRLAFHNASNTSVTFCACSATVWDHIMMSLRYA
jgi:hypothetical protein